MTKLISRLSLLALTLLLTACAGIGSYDYSAFKTSKPRSILVLPPLNNSPDLRGTYSMLATVTAPLSEAGYYVFPVALVDQTFKENGLPNPGEMHEAPLDKIHKIFGADAALYITVEQYGATYQILDSAVIVSARARLVDTRSGQLLWEGKASASNAEGRDYSSSVVGMLIVGLIRQVASSVGDPGYPIARVTSTRMLTPRGGGMLYGPRSPMYEKQ